MGLGHLEDEKNTVCEQIKPKVKTKAMLKMDWLHVQGC